MLEKLIKNFFISSKKRSEEEEYEEEWRERYERLIKMTVRDIAKLEAEKKDYQNVLKRLDPNSKEAEEILSNLQKIERRIESHSIAMEIDKECLKELNNK